MKIVSKGSETILAQSEKTLRVEMEEDEMVYLVMPDRRIISIDGSGKVFGQDTRKECGFSIWGAQ